MSEPWSEQARKDLYAKVYKERYGRVPALEPCGENCDCGQSDNPAEK